GPSILAWRSSDGLSKPFTVDKLPETLSLNPPLPVPPGLDEKLEKNASEFASRQRLAMLNACKDFGADLGPTNVGVILTEAIKAPNPVRRSLAVRCYGALDDFESLINALNQEKFPDVRQAAIASLQIWIASSRDAEYKLFAL